MAQSQLRADVGTFQGGCRQDHPESASPIVSIIVVVFRDCAELDQLIFNLAPFRGPEVELIVIDGGSDDGSVDLLKAKNNEIDFWVSGADTGIYDAMNKGISAAYGEYILHINAGDRLLDLPLEKLKILGRRQIDVVCCRVLEDGTHLFTPRNDWLLRFDNTWHHQGTFYRRSAHLRYNPTYKVFGDFNHNQRLHKAKCSVVSLETLVASHRTDGTSSNQNARNEIFQSIRSHFGPLHVVPAFVRFQALKLRAMLRNNLRKKSDRLKDSN
jgi:glycosyltransferase involved in cell wall biosynthesis